MSVATATAATATATVTTTAGPRVRIAIVSPDILARIRKEFAVKGLTVQIDRLPALELTVEPGPGATPAAAALADALSSLVGPAGPAGQRRPAASAHYRLSLVGDAAQPRTPAPRRRKHVLSPREAEVMACISHGMMNPDIAARMRLSQKTVKNHVNHIFAKLGARSRVEAVLIWQGQQSRRPL